MTFHVLFLPAWEGPDEPFHLGRIASFAEDEIADAWRGASIPGAVLAAVRARPCSLGFHRTFGCPAFGSAPAAFDLLRPLPRLPDAPRIRNPEGNQPPLFYAVAGGVARAGLAGERRLPPETLLLGARLFAVLLVAAALFLPLRRIASRRSAFFAAAGLLLLLLPGASESLARCANDAPVFFWTALVLAALERPSRPGSLVPIAAVGPLVKLTAIPVVVAAVVALWCRGRRRTAIATAAASLAVVPIQLLRGWSWGGTLELNRTTPPLAESLAATTLGLARSVWGLGRSAFWLGGMSLLRPPRLLVAGAILLAVLFALSLRRRPGRRISSANVAGALALAAGTLAFAVASRRYWGGWGGLGGWYFWSWSPWIAVATADAFTVPPSRRPFLLAATAALALAANLLSLRAAFALYGTG